MCFFFFQAEDGIRDSSVTGVQTCALPIYYRRPEEQQHGLRVRARKTVERQRGPRRLQDYRWREELEQDSQRRESVDRLLDDFHESAGLQGPFRGHVGFSQEGLGFPLRRGESHRRERQRFFPDHRWRNDLEGTG